MHVELQRIDLFSMKNWLNASAKSIDPGKPAG